MMPRYRKPLPTHPGIHTEPGADRDELVLCDVVQAFEVSGLLPTERGPGDGETCGCGLVALYGIENWARLGAAANLSYWGWDNAHHQCESLDAAWRVMHGTDTERTR